MHFVSRQRWRQELRDAFAGRSIYDSMEMTAAFYVPYHNGIVVCVCCVTLRLSHVCDLQQVPRV